MAGSTTTTLTNEYQKYFSKQLLKTAVQLTILDQFGLKTPLPKKKGAKVISFFRRLKSSLNTTTGLVDNVQTLTEGTPIATFMGATLDRVDVTLVQLGEASKVTDILSMTELFDALKQNTDLMAEDCALNADSIVRNALVAALNTGVTLNQASGTATEKFTQIYAQGNASLSALNTAGVSGGKLVATDFLRAATTLKVNRAPTFAGGMYVAAICPQNAADLQNDPDWIDAANWGDPDRRFKGEIKNFAGCRFVEHTNPFIQDVTGTEYVYAGAATAANKAFITFVLGQGAYGVPAIEGDSPYNPRMMIVNTPDKSDPLNQYMTAGWKAFWAAAGLNAPYGLGITARSEYA